MKRLESAHFTVLGILFLVLLVPNVSATVISYDLGYTWNGATPGGDGPWINITFDDEGTAGEVTMTVTASVVMGEKIKELYLNLDPLLDARELEFTAAGGSGSFGDPKISAGVNAYKAGGGGKYDILIAFKTGGGNSKTFGAGDSVSYTISNIASLTAESFGFISAAGGGEGQHYNAAHVLGIGGEESGWITVPEPLSAMLIGMGGMVLYGRRRRVAG